MQRITELPNELTSEIDQCDPEDIVRLLRQSDAQLFAGWGRHSSIQDAAILHKIDRLADRAATLLQENELQAKKNVIVFTGCGTSGRIAWACSQSFNRIFHHLGRHPCFRYLIAGGDKALIVGDELPEDDPPRGAEELAKLTSDADHVMLLGITCGFSAPYVAGQIDHGMQKANFFPVLIGFNPLELARDVAIEKWHKTCKQTFLRLNELEQTSDGGMILNPIVGPEPITGSSRMKGGSMTAILLDVIFTLALSRAFSIPLSQLLNTPHDNGGPIPVLGSTGATQSRSENGVPLQSGEAGTTEGVYRGMRCGEQEVAMLVDIFHLTYNAAYRNVSGIGAVMELASECLRHSEGHMYYVGAQLFGVVGFIDSSELVPTFGSSPREARGFVEGGWGALQNQDGDLSETGGLFQISLTDFERDILPTLSSSDCVVWLHGGLSSPPKAAASETASVVMEKVLASPAKCCLLGIVGGGDVEPPQLTDPRYARAVLVRVPYFSIAGKEPIFGAFALKLILNAISTGANILKGRVYRNTMINLNVANDKLYYRSTSIIANLSKVGENEAEAALLKVIYQENEITKYTQLPVSAHIKAAAKKHMVVPTAVVLASQQCTVEEAVDIITKHATSLRRTLHTTTTIAMPKGKEGSQDDKTACRY